MQRGDDREEVVRERLRVYLEQTSPLLDHYRKLGLLHELDGSGSVESIAKRLGEGLQQVRP